MTNVNNTQVTIKDVPESADDSIIVQFMSTMGCKTVGPVVRRKIRYNYRLTNCSNGDRVVYIGQKPVKAILRNVKIGSHWARVFYDGQNDQELNEKSVNREHDGKETQVSDSTPKTQANMEYIDKTFDEYVGEESTEHRQEDGKESDRTELLPQNEVKNQNKENNTTDEAVIKPTDKKKKKKPKTKDTGTDEHDGDSPQTETNASERGGGGTSDREAILCLPS
ncbi:Hypp8771 [Branchiostoma lanceolatum]|uniref:Hypp8771 protein n=1 Tax=Branchiostoma lanceolatum TaxID=7740 RepID=A0A8J9ZAJ8_BRALA|nr:Hypp8771 [Branchiostoma lanceolatum]